MDEDRSVARAGKPQKTYKRLSESYLRNAGLYYLQRHATSVANFIAVMDRKMQRSLKSHPDQNIMPFQIFVKDNLVQDFIRLGFLNDALYAGGLVNSLSRKGLPQGEIKRRVKAKGIDTQIIEDQELLANHDDLAAAVRMMKRKRLGAFATREREVQKDMAALARYGFSYDIVKRALAMDVETAEDALIEQQ